MRISTSGQCSIYMLWHAVQMNAFHETRVNRWMVSCTRCGQHMGDSYRGTVYLYSNRFALPNKSFHRDEYMHTCISGGGS